LTTNIKPQQADMQPTSPQPPPFTHVFPLSKQKKSLGTPLGTRLTCYSTCLVADSVFLTPGDGDASNDGCHIYRTEVWKLQKACLSLLILFIFPNRSKTLPENSLNIQKKNGDSESFKKTVTLVSKLL